MKATENHPKRARDILAGAKLYLKRKGKSSLIHAIGENIRRELDNEERKNIVTIKVADKKTGPQALELLSAHGKILPKNYRTEILVDESLIGGSIIQTSEHIIDLSHKGKLVDMYRKLREVQIK